MGVSLPRRKFMAMALLAGSEATRAQTPPTAPTAEPTARALVEAMAANDAARIRALFAPNASQAYGNGTAKSGPAFFAWLQSDIIDARGRVDNARFAASGNRVEITGQYSNRSGYRSAANFLLIVEQDRIVSWQMRY
jgi:SnoaL-like domain